MIIDIAQAVKFISEPSKFAFTLYTLDMLLLFVKHKVSCYATTRSRNCCHQWFVAPA